MESNFRDSSSSAVKWSNVADVVVYSGLKTGVKFPVYLEYFVLPIEQRPYYDLLMKQMSPFLHKVDVERWYIQHNIRTGSEWTTTTRI